MARRHVALMFLLVVLLVLSGVVTAGCGGTTTTTAAATTTTTAAATATTAAAPTTTAATASAKPIVIGFAIAQSGFGAPFDSPVARMAELAIEDLNAKGGILGRKIETVYADNKTDSAQSAIAGMELVDKKVDLMFCSSNFEVGGPAARAANDNGIVVFGPGCADLKLGVQGVGPLVYVMSNSVGSSSSVMAEFAYSKQGWKTAYVLQDTLAAFTKEAGEAFKEVFEKLGGKVVGYDFFANADTSIPAQISKIKALATAPDLIYIPSMPPGQTMAVKQLREAGIAVPICGGDTMDGDVWYEAIPDLDKVFYTTYVSEFGDDASAEVNDVLKRYRAKYPEPMSSGIAITGYATIQALAAAIDRAGTTEGKAVAAELDKFTNEKLIIGPTTFTSEWHIQFERPSAIMELSKGKHTYHGTVAPTIQPARVM